MGMSTTVFETSSSTSAFGSTEFSFDLWDSIRNRGIEPQFRSEYAEDFEGRHDFLAGARMMGYELVDLDDSEALAELEAMDPPRLALQPQQLQLSDILDSGRRSYVVEMPRRASKSTTIFLKLLGRCIRRRGYLVTFSAQNGVASGRLFDDWVDRLNEVWPEDKSLPPWLRDHVRKPKVSRHVALFGDDLIPDHDDDDLGERPRPFKARVSPSARDITIKATGSKIRVIKTAAGAYRGLAADVSWLDEAQELDAEEGIKIVAAIRPLQDTRRGHPSTIVSGTAGEVRSGLFWSYVNRLRTKDAAMGGMDFCAPEDTPWEIVEDEQTALDLLCSMHPGVGTLTTRQIMTDTYREPEFGRPQWAREYLSLWPETFGVRAIPLDQWASATASRRVPIPQRVAFGMAIKPGGGVACIAAAWRNTKGRAYVEIIEHRPGTAWMMDLAPALTAKYRGSTIAFDDIGEGKATATELNALPQRRPKLRLQTYTETAAGCVQLLRDLERGTLRHFDDVSLNSAVARAAKRETRNDRGVWLWTPAEKGEDITPLDAATRALRNWDQHFAARRTTTGVIAA